MVVVVHGDVHPQFVCMHSTTPITPKSNTMVPLLCNPPQPKRKEGKNKEKGVVFVGDFVAYHDGEWIVVVAKW